MSSPTKLLLALAVAASAISFNAMAQFAGSATGIFKNPAPAGRDVIGVGTNSFAWGTPQPARSSATFLGADFSSVTLGTPFIVGTLEYFNGTIVSNTGANNVDLELTLNFTAPSALTATSSYTLTLINTPNTSDPNASADVLQFPSELPPQTFTINGVEFTVALDVGTVTSGGGFTSQHSFHVLEGQSATATLIGTITGVEVLASGLRFPQGVAVHNGVLYIADRSGHTIWKKVLATGEISPVAGTGVVQVINGLTTLVPGTQGYNGDGISATQAMLNGPAGVAVDGNGNVFVSDSGNHIVRKINTGGMITTVAGTPNTLPKVDALGQLMLSETIGATTLYYFNGPRGISVDAAGNIFVADTMNQVVRKVHASGGISVVAGVAGFTGDNDGAVSCALGAPDCVQARLNDPRAVAVDGDGNLYVADVGSNRIRKVTSTTVTSVAVGALRAPAGVAVTSNGRTLYISDTSNHRVRRLKDGVVTTVAGTGTAGGATASQLNTPVGLALDASGDLYIADQVNNRALKVDF